MPKQEDGGKAIIERGHIVIRVAIDALPLIVDGSWGARGGQGTRYEVVNPKEFAADLVRALNDEEEDGTTLIHKMFDGAIDYAIEQGAFGVEEHPDQEGP